MAVFTDDRLVAVLAAYESGVDRVLQLIREDSDIPQGALPPGSPAQEGAAPLDSPPGAPPPGSRRPIPLRVAGFLGRTAKGRLLDPVVDLVRGTTYPGQPGWRDEPAERRAAWWVHRISVWAAGPTALPWVAGKLSDRLPIKDALSAAAQGLVVCAVSREYGVDDAERRISLLAEVLTGRRIEPTTVARLRAAAMKVQPAAGALPDEFDQEVEAAVAEPRRGVVRRAGRALWSLARVVGEMEDLLDERQKGHLAARALGALPGVGVVGGYFAEHSGLERAGRRTEQLLSRRYGIPTAQS